MNATVTEERRNEFPRAAGHALGYLAVIAAMPPLTAQLLWRHPVVLSAILLVLLASLRAYLGLAVRDALSPARSRSVLGRVDQVAIFLFIASACTVLAFASLRQDQGWLAFAVVWVLAALGSAVRRTGPRAAPSGRADRIAARPVTDRGRSPTRQGKALLPGAGARQPDRATLSAPASQRLAFHGGNGGRRVTGSKMTEFVVGNAEGIT